MNVTVPQDQLFLYEKVKLLSMKDDTGLQLGYDMMNPAAYSIVGAVQMDLLLGGWIRFDADKKCIVNHEKEPPTDAVLQAALARIKKKKKPQKAKDIVLMLAVYEHPERAAIKNLIDKGMVRLEKTGGFFSRKRYPLDNIKRKAEIISSLRNVLRSEEKAAPLETLILFRLTHSAKILPYLFKVEYDHDLDALQRDIQKALAKVVIDDGVDAALQEQERREEMFDALSTTLDVLTISIDAITDAVDSTTDASGGDGGDGDGGGDGGGGGGD